MQGSATFSNNNKSNLAEVEEFKVIDAPVKKENEGFDIANMPLPPMKKNTSTALYNNQQQEEFPNIPQDRRGSDLGDRYIDPNYEKEAYRQVNEDLMQSNFFPTHWDMNNKMEEEDMPNLNGSWSSQFYQPRRNTNNSKDSLRFSPTRRNTNNSLNSYGEPKGILKNSGFGNSSLGIGQQVSGGLFKSSSGFGNSNGPSNGNNNQAAGNQVGNNQVDPNFFNSQFQNNTQNQQQMYSQMQQLPVPAQQAQSMFYGINNNQPGMQSMINNPQMFPQQQQAFMMNQYQSQMPIQMQHCLNCNCGQHDASSNNNQKQGKTVYISEENAFRDNSNDNKQGGFKKSSGFTQGRYSVFKSGFSASSRFSHASRSSRNSTGKKRYNKNNRNKILQMFEKAHVENIKIDRNVLKQIAKNLKINFTQVRRTYESLAKGADVKVGRPEKYPKVNQEMTEWFQTFFEEKKEFPSKKEIQAKAREIKTRLMIQNDEEDNWVCSRGWLNRFNKRMIKHQQNSNKQFKASMLSLSDVKKQDKQGKTENKQIKKEESNSDDEFEEIN